MIRTTIMLMILLATVSHFVIAHGTWHDGDVQDHERVNSNSPSIVCMLEQLPWAEGEFKQLISAGPDKYAIHCAENPESACYEYNVQEKWIRLCDGNGTMIAYVVSVEYVGSFTDPQTGEYINIHEIVTATE